MPQKVELFSFGKVRNLQAADFYLPESWPTIKNSGSPKYPQSILDHAPISKQMFLIIEAIGLHLSFLVIPEDWLVLPFLNK